MKIYLLCYIVMDITFWTSFITAAFKPRCITSIGASGVGSELGGDFTSSDCTFKVLRG